jgi:hypothetical protein
MRCAFDLLKNICAKIGTHTYLFCIGGASIILTSSSTASTAIGTTTTASTATVVSSSSTAHLEKWSKIYANVTIGKMD